MRFSYTALSPMVAALLLVGCVTSPTHDSKVATSLTVAKKGNIEEAIKQFEVQLEGKNKDDLLLNLEKVRCCGLPHATKRVRLHWKFPMLK